MEVFLLLLESLPFYCEKTALFTVVYLSVCARYVEKLTPVLLTLKTSPSFKTCLNDDTRYILIML